MEDTQFQVRATDELKAQELLEILKERVKVFVVEQNCAYQEVDDKDGDAVHVVLKNSAGAILAYARIVSSDEPGYISFGRVLVVQEYRRHHLGRQLIEKTLQECERLYPDKKIKIAAQAYLQNFYASFGFQAVSEIYDEDGLPHIDMIRG
ncbi:GNAT family N-acetyltransferase [Eupransor demetentiae]|uniref:GNAT family (ElaA) n=1 Tax=Eupransor demetentiae TaxID=3109584 RepID=A0ABM9N6J8_9LACO|nr:GNAT family (ElaA) [Lactobacillaceae bacterium LMG 33000]